MRRAWTGLILGGFLALLAGCGESTPEGKTGSPAAGGQAGSGSAAGAPQLTEWTADAAMLEKLAPETADPLVTKYRLRPPKGYEITRFEPSTGPKGDTCLHCVWHDQAANHAALFLQVFQLPEPPGDTADVVAVKLSGELRKGFRNFAMRTVEQGRINGLDFARIRWNADGDKAKLHGLLYAAVDGSRVIGLNARDTEVHDEGTLRVAEAAILTWKKAE